MTRKNNRSRNSRQRQLIRLRLGAGRGAKCCFCLKSLSVVSATIEHIIPVSKGGGWNIENLKLSCFPCNNERGAMAFHEYLEKRRRSLGPQNIKKKEVIWWG